MRFLLRLRAKSVSQASLLDAARTIARALGADPRNPKWTSYGALELDVFCRTKGDFGLFVAAVSPLAEVEFTKDLNIPPPFKPEEELYAEARALFNAERYWECHEVLEGLWRTKQGDEKRLLQGIILVCAAFVHHQKGDDPVAMGVLRRALPLLDLPGDFHGFRMDRVRKDAGKIMESGDFVNFLV